MRRKKAWWPGTLHRSFDHRPFDLGATSGRRCRRLPKDSRRGTRTGGLKRGFVVLFLIFAFSPSTVLAAPVFSHQQHVSPDVSSLRRLGLQPADWDLEKLMGRLHDLGHASRDVLQRLKAEAVRQVTVMERVIEQTGLNVEDMIASLRDQPLRQGGPFIAIDPSELDTSGSDTAELNSSLLRWDMLRGIIETLPLSSPLEAYVLRSPFGKRRDPVNRRWATHEGTDLDAPYKSTVVATAPGDVVFAGWQSSYGRLVEVRHSDRVTTRYAHLARILVKKGGTVERGDPIGLLGSSGRTTGAHLHYEVLFDGRPRDPMMFINAGQATLAAALK